MLSFRSYACEWQKEKESYYIIDYKCKVKYNYIFLTCKEENLEKLSNLVKDLCISANKF